MLGVYGAALSSVAVDVAVKLSASIVCVAKKPPASVKLGVRVGRVPDGTTVFGRSDWGVMLGNGGKGVHVSVAVGGAMMSVAVDVGVLVSVSVHVGVGSKSSRSSGASVTRDTPCVAVGVTNSCVDEGVAVGSSVGVVVGLISTMITSG